MRFSRVTEWLFSPIRSRFCPVSTFVKWGRKPVSRGQWCNFKGSLTSGFIHPSGQQRSPLPALCFIPSSFTIPHFSRRSLFSFRPRHNEGMVMRGTEQHSVQLSACLSLWPSDSVWMLDNSDRGYNITCFSACVCVRVRGRAGMTRYLQSVSRLWVTGREALFSVFILYDGHSCGPQPSEQQLSRSHLDPNTAALCVVCATQGVAPLYLECQSIKEWHLDTRRRGRRGLD